MLYLSTADGRRQIGQWHVGEPIPPQAIPERVLRFQADGDELALLLTAMEESGESKYRELRDAISKLFLHPATQTRTDARSVLKQLLDAFPE